MRVLGIAVLGSFYAAAVFGQATVLGDSGKGREVFRNQQCLVCHSINAEGGKNAPDLGKQVAREFTPATLAALMWNHAPAMWATMYRLGVERPRLDAEQAADLFAYFASVRYFERPGDAGRGQSLFTSKGCAGCHSAGGSDTGKATPVVRWDSLSDSIELAQRMWNHASVMRAEVERKKLAWPHLTSQELTDILVYVNNLPAVRGRRTRYAPASAVTGEKLFQLKGCAQCHQGARALDKHLRNRTMVDVAASMWNHGARIAKPQPELGGEEMRRIVGYLESLQFLDQPGSATRGRRVFERQKCATCHNDPSSGAPALAGLRGQTSSATMVATLWQHGPAMLERMKQKNIAWPRFQAMDMADLIAFLNVAK